MGDERAVAKRAVLPTPRALSIRKASVLRTVAIWTGATGILVWLAFANPAAALASLGISGGIIAVRTASTYRQWRRFVVDASEGMAALARGDLPRARAIFLRWAERTNVSRIAALARHNLAWTLMRQGRVQAAIDVLIDNDTRNPGSLQAIHLYPTSAADLALNHALLGDIAVAETWLVEADRRAGDGGNSTFGATRAFSRAVIDCRAGRSADAARMLGEGWAEYEGTLTGETLRPLRVVRAFAFALAAGGPRNDGLVANAIAAARPLAYPGEYDFLGTA